MAHKIDTVSARAKLPPRREPYWQRVSSGLYLGFRKMTRESVGSWVIRFRDQTGRQAFEALGSLEHLPAHERFDGGVKLVRAWAERSPTNKTAGPVTVADACEQYVVHVGSEKGPRAAADIAARYRRWVTGDPMNSVSLEKLTREHFRAFRNRMLAAPVRGSAGREDTVRSRASVNRDMTALRAALNFALSEGHVSSDMAWRDALKPFPNAARPRRLYLDRAQRRALIAQAEPDLALFLRGLSTLPVRPGALAALRVADLDRKLLVLRVGKDKHGQNREIGLSEKASALFLEAAADKAQESHLFSRANGRAWDKDAWKHPVKAAALAAGLPAETTIYNLRHALISDLVHVGLDMLTIAQLSGTSVSMIEAHYGHMRSDLAMTAIERVAI